MRDGETLQLSVLATQLWPRLLRTAQSLGLPLADAEDLCQQTLLRTMQSWKHVQAANDAEAYAFKTMFNLLSKARARKWRGERPTDPALLPSPVLEDSTEGTARSLDLRTALAHLPKQVREVVVLRYMVDLSEAEVAKVLNIPVGTVKSRGARGLSALNLLLTTPVAREGQL